MQHSDFVPLHLHTEYSLLDGAIKIDELLAQAAAFKMPAVAITDHGNLFGAVEFYKKAMKAGIKPVIGCEVYIAPNSRHDRQKTSIDNNMSEEAAFHLILLARNSEGYRNLTKLVTIAYTEGFYYKPRIDRELLAEHSNGLIGLSACLKGEVAYCLMNGMYDKAKEAALAYRDILGSGNFYFELQHNGMQEQEEVNKKLIVLGRELGIPFVATNDCHYLKQEDSKAHDVLLCIGTGKTLKDEKRLSFSTDEFYFKSPDEMKAAFADMPEAIENTIEIAKRCNVDFTLGKHYLPKFEPPEGMTADKYLEELAQHSMENLFNGSCPEDYCDRLKYELQVIKNMGYSSYFLIVWDFINYSKKNGIPVGPGRGSAAGSLVAYCIGITDIDPIKYKLLFERFLNPERVSMPDIDVDFCKDRRQDVINYVSEKYGNDHVSQIITFGTMAAKAAIRDVGRALGMPYASVDKIAKLVPVGSATIEEAIKAEPQLKEMQNEDPEVKELLDIAIRLEGLSRHSSTHAAGVVIAPNPLTDFMPLYKNPKDGIITSQFDMGSVESIGLLKFDFLGLKTLTVIDRTIQYIRQQGKDLNISKIPMDDEATFRMLSSGETTGIFQLESAGMRDILIRMVPGRFEDLIALVALYRPGPMAWIDDFIRNKKDESQITYELPELKAILGETYGIILYQEQVMMIANEVAKFSLGQADLLRRAMGKKKPEEMAKQKEDFIAGAVKNDIPEKKAKELFEKMEPFAQYGFNKSHSAAYAYVAYQTAYLKTHYKVEFMAANLSTDMDDTDKIVKLINECRSMSIEVLPPDINESGREFNIIGSSIRFGLEAVKGVGTAAIESILDERKNSRFESFEQFLSRIENKKVNKKVMESLTKAGAFDLLFNDAPNVSRASAILRINNSTPKNSGMNLFGNDPFEDKVEGWDENTLLNFEKEALGFYVSGHPITRYRNKLSSTGVMPLEAVPNLSERAEACVAGVITDTKNRSSSRGVTTYITLEDETGSCEAMVFQDTAKKAGELLKKGELVVVRGNALSGEKGSRLIARDIDNLKEIAINIKYEVPLKCDQINSEKLRKIADLMNRNPAGKDSVSVEFKFFLPSCCVILSSYLQPGPAFLREVEKITGCKIKIHC
ncbi:MAG: DNA polymerase III subunit alpha [Dissulfurispiraceae bacterium]|jgi:DNA polymerase-3 subunit alpha|nr:DNA polymerase III subunit alpha [Dissulfurispiraceae bacterium]